MNSTDIDRKFVLRHLYHCTVHSVLYLINTPTNARVFIIYETKTYIKTLKTLLYASITRFSSGSTMFLVKVIV